MDRHSTPRIPTTHRHQLYHLLRHDVLHQRWYHQCLHRLVSPPHLQQVIYIPGADRSYYSQHHHLRDQHLHDHRRRPTNRPRRPPAPPPHRRHRDVLLRVHSRHRRRDSRQNLRLHLPGEPPRAARAHRLRVLLHRVLRDVVGARRVGHHGGDLPARYPREGHVDVDCVELAVELRDWVRYAVPRRPEHDGSYGYQDGGFGRQGVLHLVRPPIDLKPFS